MTLDDLKNRVRGFFDPSQRPTAGSNWTASLSTTAPSLAGMLGAHLIKPDVGNEANQIALNSPLAKKLIAESGLDIGVSPSKHVALPYGPNAGYVPNVNFLNRELFSPEERGAWPRHGMIVPLNTESMLPEVMAHEIGHGMAHHGGGLAQMLARSRMPFSLAGGLGSSVELIRGVSGNKTLEERDKLLNRASALQAIGVAPTLANEYQASSNAMKLLRRLPPEEVTEILARARKVLPRAGATYGLATLGGILGPQAAKWYYHHKANA